VLNTSRQVGGALAIAVFGALLAHQGFVDGLRTSLLIAGLLLLLATTLASLTLPHTTQR
jgi:DHA2 family methylenomycin A resistance protein-like MFS transporter